MARPRHYSPALDRQIVGALYHEAKRRKVPMTKLANALLRQALVDLPGWRESLKHASRKTDHQARQR